MSNPIAANAATRVQKRVVSPFSPIERARLFAGLALIGFVNGISHRVVEALREDPGRALLHAFDIGAVVWIALLASLYLFVRQQGQAASRRDMLAAGLAFAAFLAPAPPVSWLGLSGLSVYIAVTSPLGSASRRSAWILLALTVPMFWSRILFLLMSDAILRFDAVLVGLILGTGRSGNAIAFADGWGYFWIAPQCSSLANISLALLCWVVVTQALRRPNAALRYCLLAVVSVIVINVMRLALTGISHTNYELLHGAAGNLILGWFTFAVTLAICLYGATREVRHAVAASS
jgi:exosortase/archaeosortase family protein